ncbi:MAG: cation diffusion facilitator family transporter [Propionibacteriaceae bacterium]|jgi:cation diffusion facilitator family transporter|nr:cation diffusion facilitator family transporter [Propionibacteriaceae bacterium]
MPQPNLTKYAWLSIAAAVVTIILKVAAWRVTDSVGFLSDAAESLVNLAAAILALAMLTIAAKPADEDHQFGHTKAEYFSAAFEGLMIFIAAVLIIVSAVDRLLHPAELESLGLGIIISTVAAAINGVVGILLLRAGKAFRSPTLVADGKHLWTDVVTSVGVIIGIVLVWITQWQILDPIVALLVGVNIIVTGAKLMRESIRALMDITLPEEENTAIAAVLAEHTTDEVTFHGLRTRLAGRVRFATFDALVPGSWTVTKGHNLIEEVESALREAFPGIDLRVHLEPREDPRAYNDFDVEIPIPAN